MRKTLIKSGFFRAVSFLIYPSVLDTPVREKEVIKRLAVYQLHGNFTPGRFSADCSHCLRRFYHARTVTKQEYHYTYCLSSPRWEPPNAYNGLLIAPARNVQAKTRKVSFRCRFQTIMAQSLSWLMLITIAIGRCLMNGYLVFKVQTHSPHNGEQVRSFYVLTCFLTNQSFFNPSTQIFF